MACGTPVITTSKALLSLSVIPGKSVLVADGADRFSQNILNLLGDQKLQFKIGAMGTAYVRNCHSWRAIAETLFVYYSDTIKTTKC